MPCYTEKQVEKKGNEGEMKRIDFEHGTVTGNIFGAALPMLVAQIFWIWDLFRERKLP